MSYRPECDNRIRTRLLIFSPDLLKTKSNLSATYSLEAFLERNDENPEKISSHLLQEVEMVFDKAKTKLLLS